MKKIAFFAATIAILAAASPVSASGDDMSCENVKGQWMSKEQIKAKVAEMGYDVRRIKKEDGCYEAYILDNKGKKAEIYVNPVSGEVVKIKNKS